MGNVKVAKRSTLIAPGLCLTLFVFNRRTSIFVELLTVFLEVHKYIGQRIDFCGYLQCLSTHGQGRDNA